jgi:hypothetical protein
MVCRTRGIEAVFFSVLDYGDVVYKHASASTLKPLDSVYHWTLRFITGDCFRTQHCTLNEKVDWPFLMRLEKHFFFFIFKAFIGKQPPSIWNKLGWDTETCCSLSSELLLLKVPELTPA